MESLLFDFIVKLLIKMTTFNNTYRCLLYCPHANFIWTLQLVIRQTHRHLELHLSENKHKKCFTKNQPKGFQLNKMKYTEVLSSVLQHLPVTMLNRSSSRYWDRCLQVF